jgi:hypothetical protein
MIIIITIIMNNNKVSTDPSTGQQVSKKKLGGHYPGNRPPEHATYRPNEFDEHGQATAHFVAVGGGNALTLQPVSNNYLNNHNNGKYDSQNNKPEYIQVTLPDGVVAGQTIHVSAPDGRLNAIVIPPGFGPGSTFTVEFANETPPPKDTNRPEVELPPPTVQASVYDDTTSYASTAVVANTTPYNPYDNHPTASSNNKQDDGFASGFGR